MKSHFLLFPLAIMGVTAAYAGCSASDGSDINGAGVPGDPNNPAGTGGKPGFRLDAGVTTGRPVTPTCEKCTDFPKDAVVEAGAEAGPSEFAGTASGPGSCITEPQDGSLFPRNWLRPRVAVSTGPRTGLFQIRFHASRELNDLVVYTTQLPWAMPKDLWEKLTRNVMEEDITMTLREKGGSGIVESVSKFRVAPVDAGGTVVFWHATGIEQDNATQSMLFGFRPGDEGVITALQNTQVESVSTRDGKPRQPVKGATTGQPQCIGCHSSSPDGKVVAFTDAYPWNVSVANIEPDKVGNVPDFMTPAGRAMTQTTVQGVTSFSLADWDAGRRRYVTSWAARTIAGPNDFSNIWLFYGSNDALTKGGNKDDLIWVDLASKANVPELAADGTNKDTVAGALLGAKGSAWDVISRGAGDTNAAVTPDWSHAGDLIAYTSTDKSNDGRIGGEKSGDPGPTRCDIYTVRFGNGKGGTAAPVAGASDPVAGEYYPDFSPDDAYIAFNRVPNTMLQVYYREDAELYIVPSKGGDPIRLAANDPAACTNLKGNAVHNSWAKWAPLKQSANGATYYFIAFSSSRYTKHTIGTVPNLVVGSELYVTTVKVDDAGKLTTYPAIYLWNQNNLVTTDVSGKASATEALGLNVTPAWDDFAIPPVPPVLLK